MTYEGDENATPELVRRYLRENYADADGSPLSEAQLTKLLVDHRRSVERGVAMLSHASYVGDQIAEAAGLEWTGDDDE